VKLFAVALVAAAMFAQGTVQELCTPCHTGPSEDFDRHPHKAKNVSCDACHGKSEEHRKTQGGTPPERVAGPREVPALCGACHTGQLAGYKESRHFAVLETNARGTATCVRCHGNHAPRAAAAIQAQCERCHESRPSACKAAPAKMTAKVLCANCHVPHTLRKAGL
jgi:hypothetical protein